ncbi:helix-turn-helix domain-containing protein [Candidatus Uhrbacteria bacterium]|nr:helix-turn-helix domain-containing protein [Candidatus Uhrbacteria bacterium]
MAFVIRKFDYQETLGAKLKAIRRSANLTLSELSAQTKIRKSFLAALESGEFGRLPDPVYARNYLKTYVRALGGDVGYFLEQFESECGTCDFMKHARLPRQRARAWQFLVASRYVKIFLVALIAISVVSYIGSQVRAIVSPPDLLVYEPSDGFLTSEAYVTVSGHAEAGAQVTINGKTVLLSQTGSFETELALERGLNVIVIESAKRHSRTATEYRRVVLKQDDSISFSN